MVVNGNKLILFGGYGFPSHPIQPGAQFTEDSRYTNGVGWTNELHMFDLEEGEGGCVSDHVTCPYLLATVISYSVGA
jgi:hypothetical protein